MIIIYIIIALYAFLIAFTRFTSALTTLVPDFSNLLGILMQLFFWATPVVWSVTRLAGHQKILEIIQCMPFAYLVTAFRDAFMGGNIITAHNGIYTIFWVITILMFIWGNHIFNKNKKDFADVLQKGNRKMQETIDVLLATYNGEKYIKEQIDSILNQSYKNIRLIIKHKRF